MMNIQEQQCFLGGLGYYDLRYRKPPRAGDLAVDGISGPALTGAIRRFQQEHGKRPDGSLLQPDGIWGPATEAALRQVIGTGEPPREVPEPVAPKEGEYPYLEDLTQIRCRCGGRFCSGLPEDREFSKTTLGWANEIGRILGVKLRCTSGYRCPAHNARTPGASPNSKHKEAIAMDLQAADWSVSPQKLYDTADALIGDQGGVGIYTWGIHIDSRGYGARWDSR